ncbi:MAG: hypothetical protein DRG24_08660 [Epsilonproteobacteria bacterium]|nr:MAG: hypothetical protein DRG24_08660 [Campylobacterota bacterium]
MSSKTISIKRHNHRIHPCDLKQKDDLLNFLIAQNSSKSILIVTANDPEIIKNILDDKSVVVTSDAELAKSAELKGELLISYDLPDAAISYMLRLSRAMTHAIILLDEIQHQQVYSIERLLERTILQEYIYGFKPEAVLAAEREKQSRYDRKTSRDAAEKNADKPAHQHSEKGDRNHDNKPNRDDKRPPRKAYDSKSKDSEKSRYMGKDENGKPIFSGKSGERNHRYDGTPKSDAEKRAPRKFGVKSLKES